MMQLLSKVGVSAFLAWQMSPFSISIICDVDHREASLSGEHGYAANLLDCPKRHNICDLHVKFAKNGHVMCPIDGWVKP